MKRIISFCILLLFSLSLSLGQKKNQIDFYGTTIEVTSLSFNQEDYIYDNYSRFSIDAIIKRIQSDCYQQLLKDCIKIKSDLLLNDYGYLKLVDRVANTLVSDNNVAVVLSALLMNNYGYNVEIGCVSNRLYLIVGMQDLIYNSSIIKTKGELFYVYPFNTKIEGKVKIYSFPSEERRHLSLKMNTIPSLTQKSTIKSENFSNINPELKFSIYGNDNLLDFYSDFPSCLLGSTMMSHYTEFSNIPLSEVVKKQIYPKIKNNIKGLNQREALSLILEWCKTSFPYGYNKDKKMLFPEETLFAPFSDADDRTILFARLVMDLLGLKCIFVYYPGHPAIGVSLTDQEINGDFVEFKGERFILCDVFYYDSSPGRIYPKLKPMKPIVRPINFDFNLNEIDNNITQNFFEDVQITEESVALPNNNLKDNGNYGSPYIMPNNIMFQIDKSIDTHIPIGKSISKNVFAVIIANEDYQNESKVEYANNDGEVFKKYCNKTLGIPESNIHYIPNATLNNIIGELDWLNQVCNAYKGIASVIFYYAGHGVPDESSRNAYLLPIDGNSRILRTCYSLEDLYDILGELPAKKVTVLMDACFSGAVRDGGMLVSARSVAIKAKPSIPKGNMVVISAAQGNETAYKYEGAKHGLFTYFLLKKLNESEGKVKLGELGSYIENMVKRYSIVVNGKKQSPSILFSNPLRETWKTLYLY